jgi:pilus assembly protein CpaF
LVERAERAAALCKRLGGNQVQVYRAPPGPDNARAQIEELFDGILAEEAVDLSEGERQRLSESIVADVLGFGPLEPLLADGSVTEIMVDGYDRVYVQREGRLEDVPSGFRDNGHLMQLIYRILDAFGLSLDPRRPYLDTRLPDGSRMNVVIPPVSLEGPALTIRKFPMRQMTMEDLLRFNSLNENMVRFLEACVRARLNLVLAGGIGSGKTTVLNLIAGMIPAGERVITVENAAELRLPETITHLVRLESRAPDWEGKGEVTMQDLIHNALRMRPDRIVVGEVRAGEALDLLQAANSGHDGILFNIHAAGPHDVLARLETMVMMANPALPLRNLRQLIASGVDLITWQERLRDGTRKIVKVSEVTGMQGEVIMLQDLFEFRQTGYQEGRVVGYHTATGNVPKCLNRIREAGVDLPMDMFVVS